MRIFKSNINETIINDMISDLEIDLYSLKDMKNYYIEKEKRIIRLLINNIINHNDFRILKSYIDKKINNVKEDKLLSSYFHESPTKHYERRMWINILFHMDCLLIELK